MASPSRISVITLREITADTVRAVCNLSVREDQKTFVAPNAVSIAEAHFSEFAWFRAIYADDTPVGFVMVEDRPHLPDYFLWRFMIDERYQRLGFGKKALQLVIDHIRTRPGATMFFTSVVEGEGGPKPFYESLGFQATGRYEEGEAILRLALV